MAIITENLHFELETERFNVAVCLYFGRQLETVEYFPQCKLEVLFHDIMKSKVNRIFTSMQNEFFMNTVKSKDLREPFQLTNIRIISVVSTNVLSIEAIFLVRRKNSI